MECFKRFRNIDSHFASKQILKGQTIGGLIEKEDCICFVGFNC